MKKKNLLLSSIATALMLASAVGFNSCEKTTSLNDAKSPTTFMIVSNDDTDNDSGTSRPSPECPYCSDPFNLCAHGWYWSFYGDPCPMGAYNPETNPMGHYHVHWFDATDDCCPPTSSPFYSYCPHKGVRAHKHIVVWWENGTPNYPHVGGGTE